MKSLSERPGEIPLTITPKKDPDQAFHPSSAYECSRVYYAKKKNDYVFAPSDASMAFLVGNMYHAFIQYALVDMGLSRKHDIEKQHNVYSADGKVTKHIHGRSLTEIDNLLNLERKNVVSWWGRGAIDVAHCHTSSGDYLIDIKTVNAPTFRSPNLPPDLWNKYYYQVQLYLDWEDQEKAVLLCCEKDSPHRFKEYIIERNQDLVQSIYAKWDRISVSFRDDVPPECDCEELNKNPAKCLVRDLYTTA